ncbi:sigma-70 family RNA polymerase sigma factor [Brevibacillus choshinensis]|uniref:sigma-70 family RNA polymerase sigma factor n=1 Tax=Brevibacillus choshinensis TaxID=54911 RepID=UPI002E1FEE1B|nr:sigma-70 family RNA polymerase sigma factor [Brevibacillus choshinensis]MED4586646.1 sigma-70 family RNA polymerase sigma factor [Brevibacillus choshinensis]
MAAIRDVNPHLGHKDEVIPQNLGIVREVCNRHKRTARALGVEYDDMYSVGCIGLIKAFDNFDPAKTKTGKFSSYAFVFVDGYVRSYALDYSGLIHVPRFVFTVVKKIRTIGLEDEEPEIIAAMIGSNVSVVELALIALQKSLVSAEAPLMTKRSDNLTLADTISQDEDFTLVEVEEFIKTLSSKEKELTTLLLQEQQKRQIGKIMGYSYPTIRKYTMDIREKLLTHIS